MFTIAHLASFARADVAIELTSGVPAGYTSAPTGDVVVTTSAAGLTVTAGATGGGYELTGATINPATTKAAWVELDGITLTGTNASWACGWVGVNNAAEVVKTYTAGQVRSIVAGATSTTNAQDGASVPTRNSVMVDGHAGLFVDFTESDVIGHVSSSYSSRVAPTANESLTFGLRVPSSTDFSVTVRQIILTVWTLIP